MIKQLISRHFVTFGLLLMTRTVELSAQNPAPASPQQKPIAIIGATLHPVVGPAIPNGILLFDKGVITAIGNASTPFDRTTTEVIDATGKHVYPGTIAMASTVGSTRTREHSSPTIPIPK
jgi:imidazolonepropionase-like amidohydrolase